MRAIAVIVILLGVAACSNRNGNGGANGAASDAYIGTRPNAGATAGGATQSSTYLEQRIKQDSAAGATNGGGNTKY